MFMLISNEPINVADLQKLANQLMLNGALVIEMVNYFFSESKKNFGRLIKRGKFFRVLFQKCKRTAKCLDHISGRREFVLNLLQKPSIGTSLW